MVDGRLPPALFKQVQDLEVNFSQKDWYTARLLSDYAMLAYGQLDQVGNAPAALYVLLTDLLKHDPERRKALVEALNNYDH